MSDEAAGDPDAPDPDLLDADAAAAGTGAGGRATGEGSVRVVGTAHVSAESVTEVERAIEEERPDVVAVELDEGRYRQLRGETPDDLDAADLLEGNTVFQFLAYWMLSYVQTRLGERFDVEPGAEMLAAVDAAESIGTGVALVDRDIQVTMQRFWARLTAMEKLRLLGGLAFGVGEPVAVGLGIGLAVAALLAVPIEALAGPVLLGGVVPGLVGIVFDYLLLVTLGGGAIGLGLGLALRASAPDEEVEGLDAFDPDELTDADVVTAMMEEFRRFSPGGADALIDERDAFIAHRLVGLREAGFRVVAVVGAGHREGIERYLDAPGTLPPVEEITGRETGSRFSPYRIVGYLFTLGFLAFFLLVAMAGVSNGFLFRLFAAWFLVNAVFTAGLAKLAGAHWTSAGVGGAVAWLTSVNPLLAPGWFAGYVELRYLTVNVADIGRLNEIVDDEELPIRELIGDLFEVPLFRLIMVVALTNVGSVVGSLLFATVLIPVLFAEVGGTGEIARLMLEGARNSLRLVLGGLA
ncbi:MAG: TraB/GumN family protein [Haloarculaceae archaeon]